MAVSLEKRKIPIAEATRILNSSERKYSQEEVSAILELLDKLAEIDYLNFVKSYGTN